MGEQLQILGDQAERVGVFGREAGFVILSAAESKRIKSTAPARSKEEARELPPKNEKSEELKAELDDLLDEIDGVLEENAEEFVRSYVQKGGE